MLSVLVQICLKTWLSNKKRKCHNDKLQRILFWKSDCFLENNESSMFATVYVFHCVHAEAFRCLNWSNRVKFLGWETYFLFSWRWWVRSKFYKVKLTLSITACWNHTYSGARWVCRGGYIPHGVHWACRGGYISNAEVGTYLMGHVGHAEVGTYLMGYIGHAEVGTYLMGHIGHAEIGTYLMGHIGHTEVGTYRN